MKDNTEKAEKLNEIRKSLDKTFGKGTLIRMGEDPDIDVERFSSGSIILDDAIGGGYPRGRVIEIYGNESAGKSTLALHAVAEIQKLGGIAAYIDAEHALDPTYAAKIGVQVDDLWLSQPSSGEQALSIAETLTKTGAVDLIVVDSVTALVPQAELDGDMGDSHMGLQARLMSQALRKLTAAMDKSGTTIIFINQLRMKIGVLFGNPETTTGGNALKFFSTIRLDVRKGEPIKAGEDIVGTKVRIKVVKNKVAPPFKKAETDMFFEGGIRHENELCDIGIAKGLIKRSGAWYSYNEMKVAGRDGFIKMLGENPDTAAMLEADILMARENAAESATAEVADTDDPFNV